MGKQNPLDNTGKDFTPDVRLVDTNDENVVKLFFYFPTFQNTESTIQFKNLEEKKFYQLKIPNAGFISKEKRPLIPSFGRYIRVPAPCCVPSREEADKKIKVRKIVCEHFKKDTEEDVWIMASQEDWTVDSEEKIYLKLDEAYYHGEIKDPDDIADTKDPQIKIFPKDMVVASGSYKIHGRHAILVHVTPFEYYLGEKRRLLFYPALEVEIPLTFIPGTRAIFVPYDGIFDNVLVQPVEEREARFEQEICEGQHFKLPTESTMYRDAELLIMYHKDLEQAAVKLAKWKNRKGITTAISRVGRVGDEMDLSPNSIKKHIWSIKEKLGSRLRYVMLIGDADLIKPNLVNNVLTDYYYSTKEDDYTEGKGLVFPRLGIGRLPLKGPGDGNGDDVDAVIEQIINYEKSPPTDPDYYKKITCAGLLQALKTEDERACTNYINTLESICGHLQSIDDRFEFDRVYVADNQKMKEYCDGTPIDDEQVIKAIREFKGSGNETYNEHKAKCRLTSALKEGRLIFAHRDHGTEHGWKHPFFVNKHLEDIGKIYAPSIFFNLNCKSGNFEGSDETDDAFSETLLKKGGVPSLIAATGKAGTWYCGVLLKALFDALWPGLLPVYPKGKKPVSSRYNRIGDILNYAKTYLPVYYRGDERNIQRQLEIFHVLGDPTLEIWTSPPKHMTMKVESKSDGFIISFSEYIEDSIVTFSYESLSQENEFHYYSIKPTSGLTKLEVSMDQICPDNKKITPEKITITFYAPGYRVVEWPERGE